MKRTILALAAALCLVVSLASVAAAGDGAEPGIGEPPVAEPTTAPDPTPTPFDGNGEIVIDPTFIAPTPTTGGQVAGATGRPDVTPPPTDIITAATTSGTGLHVLLVLGVAGSLLALLVARVPPARRR